VSVLKRLGLSVVLLGLAMWGSGCSSTSPVLLQLPSERGGTAEIPLKIGVDNASKPGSQQITDIDTCAVLAFRQYYGKMPRRSEVNYFAASVGDYLRDTKTFSYCYDAPFDRNDVDLVLKLNLDAVSMHNSGFWGTFMNSWASIPYLGFPVQIGYLVGLPQEGFGSDLKYTAVIETPVGKEVARYKLAADMNDFVNMYEQPYGNYMWYDSVFQKAFFSTLDQLKASLVKDRAKIMAGAGK
jgi:hypothetical protein